MYTVKLNWAGGRVCEPKEFPPPGSIVIVFSQDVCNYCRKSKGNSQRHGYRWLSSAKGGKFVQIILNLEDNFETQLRLYLKKQNHTYNFQNK